MLTLSEIEQFHRTGFLTLKGIFQGRELEELQAAATRVASEGATQLGQDHWSRAIDGKNVYFRSERLWQRDDIFQAAAVNPDLLECIGQLFGHPFLPMNDSMVCKLPEGRVPVEWHQDPPYQGKEGFLDTFGVPNFDVDIYLDETTEKNGCLWVIPEHHLVGKVDIEQYSEEELYRKHGAEPVFMQPGDVGLHALSAPHGSRGNESSDIRKVLFFHYVTKEVYNSCYAGWMTHNGGYTAEGINFVQKMLEKRTKLGFNNINQHVISYTEDGFVYNGDSGTPPNHWSELIKQIPTEEKEKKRQLKWYSQENANNKNKL